MKTSTLFAALLCLAAAPSARAAADILVEGRDATLGTWPKIDDEDLNPNQAVTEFGNVTTGSSGSRTFRVRNQGNSTLNLTSIVSDDSRYSISGISQTESIPANGEEEFTITFSPLSLGEQQATITIRSNDPDDEDPYTFALTGTGTGPEVNVYGRTGTSGDYFSISDGDTSPTAANATHFGTLAAGSTRTYYFKLYNSGNTSLNVQAPAFTGSGSSSFTVSGFNSAINLAAGNSRLFEIRFNPATAGTKTATFSFGSNDGNENPFNFSITGVATGDPEIVVEGNDAISWPDIADGDLDPNQVVTNFGNVNIGSSDMRWFRVRNVGTDTLTVSSRSSSSGQFTFEGLPDPLILAPGAEENFQVFFTPTTYGETTTTITLNNNDPGSENVYTFALKGTGLGAEIGIAGAVTSSGSYTNIPDGDTTPITADGTDFGTTPIGTPIRRYFRITNSGSDGLNIQQPSLTGSGAGHFEIVSLSSALNIGAGNTRDFEIRFDPTTVGAKTAIFSLPSNDQDENPYNFTVTGVATGTPDILVEGFDGVTWPNIDDGDLDPDQAVTKFGSVAPGTSEARTFRLRNQGTSTLNISSVTSSSALYTVSSLAAGNTIAPGGEREFTVNFAPLVRSTVQTVISINSNAPGGLASYTFALTGTGKGPEIAVGAKGWFFIENTNTWQERERDVDANDFTPTDAEATTFLRPDGSPEIPAGQQYEKTIVIYNEGDAGLDISTPFVTGGDAAQFNVTGISGLTNIAPGNSRTFTVRYQPASAGTHQTQVVIPSNDADEGVFVFDVKGTALNLPVLEFQRNAGPPDLIPIWVNENDAYDFGNTNLAAFAYFRLRNRGSAPAAISSWIMSNEQFIVYHMADTFEIPAGGEEEFHIVFHPEAFDTFTGETLSFFSAGASTPVAVLSLSGAGIGPLIVVEGLGSDGNWREIIDGSTTASETDGTDFGSWNVDGGKKEHTFRLRNAGNRGLLVTARDFTGAEPEDFDVSNLLGALGNLNLSPGETKEFTISYNPDSVGISTATLTLRSDDYRTGSFNFRLRGTGFGHPEIEVKGHSGPTDPFNDIADGETATRNTDGTAFGNVDVAGGTEAHVFKIKNTGNDALVIDSITENSPHFTITGGSTIDTIPVGGEAEFSVTFNPSTHGTHTAVIEIENDDADEGTFTFTVSGSGRAPDLEVRSGPSFSVVIGDGDTTPSAAESTDFGVMDVSAGAVTNAMRLVNTGNEPLTITAFNVSDPQFTVSGLTLPRTITAGTAFPIDVLFNPSSTGAKTATISFTSDDPDENPYNFRVKGYGGDSQPEIQVVGDNSTPFTSGQTVTTVTAGTQFGSVEAGSGSAVRSFTIFNSGTGVLTVSSITDNAPAFSVSDIPASVPALGSASFTVTYSPTVAAAHTATITIASNDADESAFTFNVSGTGTAAPPPQKPEINILGGSGLSTAISAGDTSPAEAKGTDLGEVEIGTSVTKTFRIRNTGNAPLTITGAAFASAPRFSVSGVASTIPAGGSDDFTVTYTPTNEGATTRVLTILNNDDNEGTYAISFTATAVTPPGDVAITAIAPEGGNKVSLTFTSIPGRTYRVMRSDDLQSWIAVAGLSAIPGDTAPQTYSMPRGTTGSRYWRVEQE